MNEYNFEARFVAISMDNNPFAQIIKLYLIMELIIHCLIKIRTKSVLNFIC